MTIETGLYSRLSGDNALTTLVGTRIWPVVLTQSSDYPAVTYRRRESKTDYGLWNAPPQHMPLWEIDCYATTYAGARAVGDRIKVLLDRFVGDLGGADVLYTMIRREEEEAVDNNGTEIMRVRLWFEMAYQE